MGKKEKGRWIDLRGRWGGGGSCFKKRGRRSPTAPVLGRRGGAANSYSAPALPPRETDGRGWEKDRDGDGERLMQWQMPLAFRKRKSASIC